MKCPHCLGRLEKFGVNEMGKYKYCGGTDCYIQIEGGRITRQCRKYLAYSIPPDEAYPI